LTQIWRELIFTELGLALVADQWVPAPRRHARVADQKVGLNPRRGFELALAKCLRTGAATGLLCGVWLETGCKPGKVLRGG
jgi:hypothetical protein